jgi:hypothetical protein
MADAREYIRRWFAEGYVDTSIGPHKQDHYGPNLLYKVRIMSVTKVVTLSKTENAASFGINDEEAHWLDGGEKVINPFTVEM